MRSGYPTTTARMVHRDTDLDDENLVSCAGLAPVMPLAEQTGLSQLLKERVRLDSVRVAAHAATLRRQIVNVPARLARPQRRRVLHLPEHWPWAENWLKVWRGVFGQGLAPPATT